jgi:hypothetical protein
MVLQCKGPSLEKSVIKVFGVHKIMIQAMSACSLLELDITPLFSMHCAFPETMKRCYAFRPLNEIEVQPAPIPRAL